MTEDLGLAALTPEERRARLALLLRARARQPRESPVSFAQRRLWLLDRLEPGTALYNLPIGLRLSGRVDLGALERALNEVVRRHEVLRTTFAVRDGEPVQLITPSLTVPLPVIDLRDRPATAREVEAMARATDEIRQPFDLARGPLLRVGVLRLDEDEHLLFLDVHLTNRQAFLLKPVHDGGHALTRHAVLAGQFDDLPAGGGAKKQHEHRDGLHP